MQLAHTRRFFDCTRDMILCRNYSTPDANCTERVFAYTWDTQEQSQTLATMKQELADMNVEVQRLQMQVQLFAFCLFLVSPMSLTRNSQTTAHPFLLHVFNPDLTPISFFFPLIFLDPFPHSLARNGFGSKDWTVPKAKRCTGDNHRQVLTFSCLLRVIFLSWFIAMSVSSHCYPASSSHLNAEYGWGGTGAG